MTENETVVKKRPWQTTVLVVYSMLTLLTSAVSFVRIAFEMISNEHLDPFVFFPVLGRFLLAGAIIFCIFRARKAIFMLMLIQIIVGAAPYAEVLSMAIGVYSPGGTGLALISLSLIFLVGFAFCVYCLSSEANVYWLILPQNDRLDEHAGGYERGYESGYTRGYASGVRDSQTGDDWRGEDADDADAYIEDGYDEEFDALDYAALDAADQPVPPEALDAWNAFCAGGLLESAELAVERESERLGELDPLELLRDCPIHGFLKAEPYIRGMVRKTGEQALEDLRGYEKAPRNGLAGGDCTVRHNCITCRVKITENAPPLQSKARLELDINVR